MCCQKASCGFVTSGFWQTDSALLNWPGVGNSWRWISHRQQSPHPPAQVHPPGTARTAAHRWSQHRDSPPRNSRGAVTSIRPNDATSSGPATCAPHATAHVCSITGDCLDRWVADMPPIRYSISTVLFGMLYPRFPLWSAGSSSAMPVPKGHSIPIASVRRKHQRLPSSLLIENASARSLRLRPNSPAPRRFR